MRFDDDELTAIKLLLRVLDQKIEDFGGYALVAEEN
jgi:hypothetical protein